MEAFSTAPPSNKKILSQSAQHAATGNHVHHEQRWQEKTILYQLVQECVETFLRKLRLKPDRDYLVIAEQSRSGRKLRSGLKKRLQYVA